MTEQPADAQLRELLQTLAMADPDFRRFEQDHAALGQIAIPGSEQTALGRDLLALLRESPPQAARIEALSQAPPERFDAGLATVPLLVAGAFLLCTHIRFERRADGRFKLLIEHKPADSRALTRLLDKLAGLLPGNDD